MGIAETFFAYAQAFESTFEDDDWSRLEQFFSADVVYLPGDGKEIHGRREFFDHLKHSLDTFDRLFDLRRVEPISQPVVTNSQVAIGWKATYAKKGLPDLVLIGSEVASFQGNLICRLEDSLNDGVAESLENWTGKYGDRLSE